MTLVVRTVGPDDAALAAGLHALCFKDSGERTWSADEFRQLLATPGCLGMVAVMQVEPAGLALARVAFDEAEVLTLGVVPSLRRQGIGGALLARLRHACHQRGARSLFLEVAEDNLPARRLYEANGFVVMARREGYYARSDGRRAALVLRRALAPDNPMRAE
jgi:ribosomal-protein-alanine N-acetyltransferase